jgi:hypothetical protein
VRVTTKSILLQLLCRLLTRNGLERGTVDGAVDGDEEVMALRSLDNNMPELELSSGNVNDEGVSMFDLAGKTRGLWLDNSWISNIAINRNSSTFVSLCVRRQDSDVVE